MGKFRKKPVVIDAIEWNGQNKDEVRQFATNAVLFFNDEDEEVVIETLEGNMTASKHDWIIRGVKGEYYPCKPDVFERTYEVAE